MIEDIIPDLLDEIKKDFNKAYKNNPKIKKLLEKLETNNLTYDDAYDYAEEVGEILVTTFKKYITPEDMPDGKMYYNIAKRLLEDTLTTNHDLVADYSQIVQTVINKNAGYNINALKAKLNPNRINGFIQRLASEDLFAEVDWILDEPVRTFTRATVDETVKTNADFNYKLGIEAVIERTERYDACSWCRALEGTYKYPDEVPAEVYMRHDNCRGRVLYRPENKRKAQNVHSKEWTRR